jgi:hypothetical protein
MASEMWLVVCQAVIPEINISIASEALPVRANVLPWFIIPAACQNREPLFSARATTSWPCAAAAAKLPQRMYNMAVWFTANISVAA